jgi:hypothetical protein
VATDVAATAFLRAVTVDAVVDVVDVIGPFDTLRSYPECCH